MHNAQLFSQDYELYKFYEFIFNNGFNGLDGLI